MLQSYRLIFQDAVSRQEVVKYFRLAHAAMNSEDGSILLLDMLGGHAGESSVKLLRQNEITGVQHCLTMTPCILGTAAACTACACHTCYKMGRIAPVTSLDGADKTHRQYHCLFCWGLPA